MSLTGIPRPGLSVYSTSLDQVVVVIVLGEKRELWQRIDISGELPSDEIHDQLQDVVEENQPEQKYRYPETTINVHLERWKYQNVSMSWKDISP